MNDVRDASGNKLLTLLEIFQQGLISREALQSKQLPGDYPKPVEINGEQRYPLPGVLSWKGRHPEQFV